VYVCVCVFVYVCLCMCVCVCVCVCVCERDAGVGVRSGRWRCVFVYRGGSVFTRLINGANSWHDGWPQRPTSVILRIYLQDEILDAAANPTNRNALAVD
jgi:hypothetical protein